MFAFAAEVVRERSRKGVVGEVHFDHEVAKVCKNVGVPLFWKCVQIVALQREVHCPNGEVGHST